jgi:hypothetical protein
MNHCLIKLFVVVVIGIFSLPKLSAQDTTITIYGKNFSSRVIVKLNGTTIPTANVRHDLFQPSKVLYVTIPFADLRTITTAELRDKNSGASLSSSNIGTNTISVSNPGQSGDEAISSFYVLPRSPYALLDSNLRTLTAPFAMPRVGSGQTVTLSLAIQYKNLTGDLNILKKIFSPRGIAADTAAFEVLDSTGNASYSPVAVSGNGYVRFRLRCTGGNILGVKRMFLAPTLFVSGVARASDQYETRFFNTNEFKVLVAYTDSSSSNFTMYGLSNTKNPRTLIDSCFLKINSLLDIAVVSGDSSKFANTRFVLATTPFKVAYKETSPDPHLHADIDTLEKSRTIRTCIPEIYDSLQVNRISQNLKCTILLVNTKGTPYRAIASEPLPSGRPAFVVAEIKYIDRFLQGTRDYVDSFFNMKATTLTSFFYDTNLLTDLRAVINVE